MNAKQEKDLRNLITSRIDLLRATAKSGSGRNAEAKEANCDEILFLLRRLELKNNDDEVKRGAEILGEVLGNRVVEWQRPPADGGAAQKLATLLKDSSGVSHVINGVTVQLDCDQLKHQHPKGPIGTRAKGGGNRFINTCNAAWHQANTMTHMATWANALGAMAAGQTTFHGQAVPVNGVHYEGFCLFANGEKYVSFHCYPNDKSDLKL